MLYDLSSPSLILDIHIETAHANYNYNQPQNQTQEAIRRMVPRYDIVPSKQVERQSVRCEARPYGGLGKWTDVE